ncbi:MAG: SHOCT domain-containing protein [Dehalococcoidia bacterium]|nr:SHOCT domain-containing protein [Dehalococcoidia bacterium]
MWGVHDGMGWWMLLGSVWFIFFWGLIIWASVTAFSRSQRSSAPGGGETPLDIAKRRYAQGEISREQYEQIRHDLGA